MKKWPEYMVTTDQCDIACAFLDAIRQWVGDRFRDSYRIYRACFYGDIIDQRQIRCMLWGWSWRGLLAADVADPAREEPLGGEHDREGDPV